MAPWLLLNPLPLTLVGGNASGVDGAARLLSHEPKEVGLTMGGVMQIVISLSRQSIDTVFLGFSTSMPAGALQCWSRAPGRDAVFLGALDPVRRPGQSRGHALIHLAQPIDTTEIVLVNSVEGSIPAGVQLGVLAVGRAFRSALGYEFGHGRGVIDTGTATRRRDGGFNMLRGARATTWKWTLGDLSSTEADALEDILIDVGETAPVVVVEDVAQAATNPRVVHWSRIMRVEPYDRRSPRQTRWNLQIEDWS